MTGGRAQHLRYGRSVGSRSTSRTSSFLSNFASGFACATAEAGTPAQSRMRAVAKAFWSATRPATLAPWFMPGAVRTYASFAPLSTRKRSEPHGSFWP